MKRISAILLLLLPLLAGAQHEHTQCHYRHPEDLSPREHSLDIVRQELHVSFVPQEGRVNGKVTHYFKVLQQRVDTLFFDAPGITIQAATCNGKAVNFKTRPEGVVLYFDQPLTWDETNGQITFTYTATPRKGLYFIGWNDPKNLSRKQIWTQGQGIDNRYWIPSYDFGNDKMITENYVTMAKPYSVLSNGTLLETKDNGDGTQTWHYRMTHPHANYLLMLGIGEYKIMDEKTKSGVPVHLWYYPDHEDRKQVIYRHGTAMIDFFENYIGVKYPWESYSQIPVQDFMYGAMENTTATLFGDFFCGNKRDSIDRNYMGVNAHELAHQWFGDLVTGRSHSEGWLQESFATFYPTLFFRHLYGDDRYQWDRWNSQQAALNAAKTDNHPIRSVKGGSVRWYPKGATVLGMMQYTFGEEAYNRVIRHYLNRHRYNNVETNDLVQSYQDTLGKSVEWFVDQWVYRGGEPHYRVHYQDETVGSARRTAVHVEQIHQRHALIGLFRMPFWFEVHYTDGTTDRVQQWIENPYHVVHVPNNGNKRIAFVLFDPGSQVLKTLTFRRTLAELEAQALKAPLMIDRYQAVLALDTFKMDQKRPILLKAYERETFEAVKAEVVRQLVNDNHPDSKALVRNALKWWDAPVRKAAINNVTYIPEDMRPAYEGLLADSSYDVCRAALKKLCYDYPANAKKYLQQSAQQVRGSLGERAYIDWLVLSAAQGDTKATRIIAEFASQSYEFRTRISAMQALRNLDYIDTATLSYLAEAACSPNTRLATPAQETLKHFVQKDRYRTLVQQWYRSQKWLPWQVDILKKAVEQ